MTNKAGRSKSDRFPRDRSKDRAAYGIAAWFDCISEGDTLADGGTIETTYNEHDQPVDATILDDEGTVLFRIVRTYDADGRLSHEKLTIENTPLPKAFRDQIPVEYRGAALAEMKAKFAEISQRTGLYGDAERIHVYNEQGRLAERRMRMGPIREDRTWKYNDRGDAVEWTRTADGLPHETGEISEPSLRCACIYEYDERGNWTSRTESTQVAEHNEHARPSRALGFRHPAISFYPR